MTIPKKLWHQPLHSVNSHDTVNDAAKLMAKEDIGALVVVEHGAMVGMLSERDVVARVLAKELDPKVAKVGEVMTKEVVSVAEKDTVNHALWTMSTHNIRHLPMLDANQAPVAMLSFRELYQYKVDNVEAENRALAELARTDALGG